MSSIQAIRDGLILLVCSLPIWAVAQETPRVTHAAWIDEVQTYAMVPLLPATAAKMNVSVNGIWAGISSDHPILPSREMIRSVRKKYGTDVAAFVKDCHDTELIVCGIVNGIEGMESLREEYPDLEEMACRKADQAS